MAACLSFTTPVNCLFHCFCATVPEVLDRFFLPTSLFAARSWLTQLQLPPWSPMPCSSMWGAESVWMSKRSYKVSEHLLPWSCTLSIRLEWRNICCIACKCKESFLFLTSPVRYQSFMQSFFPHQLLKLWHQFWRMGFHDTSFPAPLFML